jgi:hypothetical protein
MQIDEAGSDVAIASVDANGLPADSRLNFTCWAHAANAAIANYHCALLQHTIWQDDAAEKEKLTSGLCLIGRHGSILGGSFYGEQIGVAGSEPTMAA